ncbi:MAG: RNA 2',3'-cyclic phosphodiesterase [Chloroflexota bacterium]|nr:RNA 2',3'-cyclic phosphodiesterase [Chloroflexota bacterium]
MTADSKTVRVFVALDLPDLAKAVLRQTVQELESVLPAGVRWVDPGGIHLTLKFLGDVDTGSVDLLLGAMDKAARKFGTRSFPLSLSALGVFPNAREPRVLWAGVEGDLEALARLQLLMDEALSEVGFARERRPFRPHLTLGRVRDQVSQPERKRIGEVMGKARLAGDHCWEAREIHLIRSTLTPGGAIYDSIGVKPLATAE